ncbi:probable LRR receptor-like serine/threonine-protein kinase At3g47570 [Actinidia eriantha]|uniref:probable LRR receptor-like serine/threonine-protein kinase At3g47570 n=1 Tax=Actinidia eriantha TaxID=165200 RepID=UPI002587FB53|nr:probable LRR receptor-like serine/threonine-protein kinase At3g47570 [Actinidia eriantha]
MSLQQSIILASTATSRPGGNETDRLALLAFKAKVTEDPLQVTSSWNATVHFCQLPGVTVLNLRVPETCWWEKFLRSSVNFQSSRLSTSVLTSKNLTGHIPPAFGNLSSLQELLAGENHLVGKIPDGLSRLADLTVVVRENRLTGDRSFIFEFFERHSGFKSCSQQFIGGEIPECLEDFDFLQNLGLSFNDFGGEVPTEGIFKNVSATSLIGNSKLCGGVPELQLPKCETKKRSTFSLKFVSCGLVGAILLMGFVYWFWFKKKSSETSSVSLEHSLLRVSYQDLLKATDGFSSANLIVVGSFGSLYKGFFSDGMVVAVNVRNLLHRGASTSFLAECITLRNIRHRNLVKVLTARSGTDYQGNVFKALIYQYMVNGSLDEWLNPHLEEHTVHEMPANLNLLQRVNIAIDVASALDYRHHHCQIPIVRCDLKPGCPRRRNECTCERLRVSKVSS